MYLGEIIERLESVPPETVIKRGFCNPHSWRGVYAELAVEPSNEPTTAGEMARLLRSCIGSTFQGYKGGDFTMNDYSDLHISRYGEADTLEWDWLLDFLLGDV